MIRGSVGSARKVDGGDEVRRSVRRSAIFLFLSFDLLEAQTVLMPLGYFSFVSEEFKGKGKYT